MTVDINLSEIGGNKLAFAASVEKYIVELTAFTKTIGKPRPTAHILVEAAIKRVQTKGQPDKFVADYNIVDDTPKAPEVPVQSLTLEDRKVQLHSKLLAAETIAKDKLLPPRKHRYAAYSYEQANMTPEQDRTPEQLKAIDFFIDINTKWSKIGNVAAKAEADIEDLTEENIKDWQVPSFEGCYET